MKTIKKKNLKVSPNLGNYGALYKKFSWRSIGKEIRLFSDRFNAAYIAVDRHVKNWRKNKVAIYWEGIDREEKYTFRELSELSNKFANVLKKLKVEKTIVQKFLNEYEPLTSLIILKNEIQRIFELSKTIVDLLNKNRKIIYPKLVMQELEKVHKVKIAYPYLTFLYEVVENYFGVEIPKPSGVSDFLGSL